jgi:hypothetical protein
MVPISAKAAERRSRIRLSCSLVLRKKQIGKIGDEFDGKNRSDLRTSTQIGTYRCGSHGHAYQTSTEPSQEQGQSPAMT